MVGGVTYNADILEAGTARRLRDRYLTLLAHVSEDPHQPIEALNEFVGGTIREVDTTPDAVTPASPTNVAIPVEAEAMKTPGEALLAQVWRELLGAADVRTGDNFFDIGGHSLLAVDMAVRVQRETGVRLNLLDIANGTLGTLAAELSGAMEKSAHPAKRGLRHLFGWR